MSRPLNGHTNICKLRFRVAKFPGLGQSVQKSSADGACWAQRTRKDSEIDTADSFFLDSFLSLSETQALMGYELTTCCSRKTTALTVFHTMKIHALQTVNTFLNFF